MRKEYAPPEASVKKSLKNFSFTKKTATVMLTVSNRGNIKNATIVFKEYSVSDAIYLGKTIMKTLHIPDNVNVFASKSGWLNQSIAVEWHSNTFKDDRNLLLDMAGSHRSETFVNSFTEEQRSRTVYVPSKSTDFIQPLDISVMKYFKDRFKFHSKNKEYPRLRSAMQSDRQHVINCVSASILDNRS